MGSYASSTGTWTIGDLSASSSATLAIAATVNGNTAGQTITNTASAKESAAVTDPNLSNNSSSVSVNVQNNPCGCNGGLNADLSMQNTVSSTNPSEGNTVIYTLTATDLGPDGTIDVVATDTLPSGLTFVSATSSAGTYSSSTGTWTIGNLSVNVPVTLQITATVNAGTAGSTITDTAVVGQNSLITDPNLANNTASSSLTVQPNGCTSNCGGGGGTPASSTLTVVVAGLNASDTAVVSVNDITASTTNSTSTGNGSVPFILKTNDQYAVTATSTGSYSEATSTGCSGTLAASATCTITFTAISTTPSTDADIAIAKTVDNANPAPGATVNYTVTVTAMGPATSTFVTAQDLLPVGLSLVSATTSVGAYDMSTGVWTIGTLSPNATATLTMAASVNTAYAGQTITNTATVSELSSLVDPNTANNSSSVSIAVQSNGGGLGCSVNCGGGGGGGGSVATAEMNVSKTVDNATPNAGDTIHYTVKVSALGPANSVGVVANDVLPTGLTFVSATSTEGTYNASTGVWTIGQILDGTSQTLTITATVNAGTNGDTITNTATISESPSVNDPSTTGNTSSVSIVVGGSGGSVAVGGGGSTTTSGGGGGTVLGNSTSTATSTGQVLGASTSCGLYLDQYIHPIRKDLNSPVEVKKLQVFLNQNVGTNLPITGYYGPLTIAAVNQFQVKYNNEVLKPWLTYGLPTQYTPTSYVYKTTQRWINLIMCSSLNLPVPQLP